MKEIKCPNCGKTITIEESTYAELLNQIKGKEFEEELERRVSALKEALTAQTELEKEKAIKEKEQKIIELENNKKLLEEKINGKEKDIELAVAKATDELNNKLHEKDNEITNLSVQISNVKKDSELAEAKLKEDFNRQIELEKEETKKWKEYRYGDSTKDIGESLEKYCKDSFDEIRADAYPRAYFEKDNDAIKYEDDDKGSKGDFIFKDFSPDGVELVSIMFEMKTEKDTTETKKTNESFLKKLDSDRTKKGCEYAVLVSTLESDSKLYNKGIIDVSYKYPKMYVIRPQFFLSIIGLIRNMSLDSYEFKKEVVLYKEQHVDIAKFQDEVQQITERITNDYLKAGKLYGDVEKMCDSIIKKVQDFKEVFRVAQGHFSAAKNHLNQLSPKELSKNNPTIKKEFESLEKK